MRQDVMKTNFFKWSMMTLALSGMVLLPALVLTGCSDNPITAKNERNKFFDQPYSESITTELPGNALYKTLIGKDTYVGEGLISAANGGIVDIAGTFVFRVAPGSIPADTVIKVEVTRFVYDSETIILQKFKPDGLIFSKSASLDFSLDLFGYKTNTNSKIYWLNPSTNNWDWLADTDYSRSVVSIPIDHFSMYGVE